MTVTPLTRMLVLPILLLALAPATALADPVSEEMVLAYASKPYDKSTWEQGRVTLGTLNNAEVVVDYFCSDICPNYTIRIIHFRYAAGCELMGGVEKSVMIPVSIASAPRSFCFPKILV